mmetsp:Transcript_2191/g.4688  ORF Transcript_2191/g.4688 Transcript_2191/m.4688 type:complete len:1358 (+) Transcript_2191:142-4215(+)
MCRYQANANAMSASNSTTEDGDGDGSNESKSMVAPTKISPPWPDDPISASASADTSAAYTSTARLRALYDRWTFSYMDRIFRKGARQKKDKSVEAQLTQDDLFRTPNDEEAALLDAKFWRLYEETNGNFFRTLWHLASPTFVPAGFCQFVALAAQLSIPMCVMKLLQAVEASYYDTSEGGSDTLLEESILYVLLIFFLSILSAFCTQRYQFLSYQSGIVIRTAVTSATYQHSLRLTPRGREGLTSGYVTNLVATDTQKLFEVMQDGHMVWSAPIAIVTVIALLYHLTGPSSLVGSAVLVGLVPLSKKVAYAVVKIRRKRVAVADERIEITTAMLQGIKVTKLNNYEDQFEERVAEARRREMKLIQKEQSVWGFTLTILVFTPVLGMFATFSTYVLVSEDNIMTASMVFTLAMLFNMLKFPINSAGTLLGKAALGVQAMQRLSHFIARESNELSSNNETSKDGNVVLEVANGEFYVGNTASEASLDTEKVSDTCGSGFTLSGVNFSVARGEVVAVVGSVASGKSTLIQGLLGDIQSSSDTRISSLSNNVSVSVACQTPFILSTTVRENILFGSSFDKERYERVLDACCLNPDLQAWPAGDLTEIGERGVTMSGGQKARVSIARAVYANPDLALFDDVLSALDAGTSQRVFENLFENVSSDTNGLLHNSGVVLVTHAVHVLRHVSKVLALERGEVTFYGKPNEAPNLSVFGVSYDDGGKEVKEEVSGAKTSALVTVPKENDAKKGELMTIEEREHGMSAIKVWLLWFQYAGGIWFVTVQIVSMTLDRGSYVAIDWWLSTWTESAGQSITVFGIEFPNQFDGRSAQYPYLAVYAILASVNIIFLVFRTQWAIHGGIRTARRVFSTVTRRVLHAPMSYFDTTPLGRILNRFTFDVEQVDIALSQFMSIFIIACSWLVAGQVVMIAVVPYMAVVNAFVLFLYVLVLRHYRWSATDLQRLDAVSRSPIQAALSEALDGSTTIRAFRKNDYFLNQFQQYINDNSAAMLCFVSSRRWLAIRIEILGAIITLASCLFISTLYEQMGLSPGLSGFLILWSTTMTITLGFLISAFSDAEAAITSIERLHSMEILPQEKSMINDKVSVDPSWPRKGELEFKNVALRYRPGLPLSLNGLSFKVQHGSRCAVVGRTGAGKSTITTALFRLVEIEQGTILLDGIDLSTMGLSDVRGRPNGMFILPQDPAIFSGTIESNLDPFSSHTSDDILNALKLIQFPGIHRGTDLLKDTVEEGGASFSAGEKQLLCLARAMLANPRLLVLDEATSAVDGTTDEFVQRMLRSQFPDTTLLTIAHRLNTIIDYDAVIVMDKGKVSEFGSPRHLLEDKDGVFTSMVNATGPNSSSQLKQMAR